MLVCFCAGPPADALEPKAKQLLNDLKHAQVKILSFLTWMLRTFPTMVAPHQVGPSVPCHLSKHASLISLIGMGIAATRTLRYLLAWCAPSLAGPNCFGTGEVTADLSRHCELAEGAPCCHSSRAQHPSEGW